MDYTYTNESAETQDDLYLAKWLDQKNLEGVEVATASWETASLDAQRVISALTVVGESPTVRQYQKDRGFICGVNFQLRWNKRASKFDVALWHWVHDKKIVATAKGVLPVIDSSKLLKWFYIGRHGLTHDDMPLTGKDPLPAFYPWIDDLNQLYKDFVESSANVLLLIGPPGTGKTTFLRGLLRQSSMQAWVTYDPKVQEQDQLYLQFSTIESEEYDDSKDDIVKIGPGGRMLVLEDSDELLGSRKEGNTMMSRLLNLSDGLISLPARKLVFSTNLPHLSSVDPALLRPGRCFGAINFRELTGREATNAYLSVYPNGERVFADGKRYKLAEVLNEQHGDDVNVVRKIGFA
jgi:hypothetical protein